MLTTIAAYMMERHFTSINSFATFLDDEDICQMLPVCAEQFDRGVRMLGESMR